MSLLVSRFHVIKTRHRRSTEGRHFPIISPSLLNSTSRINFPFILQLNEETTELYFNILILNLYSGWDRALLISPLSILISKVFFFFYVYSSIKIVNSINGHDKTL